MAPRRAPKSKADTKGKGKGKKPAAIATITRSRTLRASTQAKTQDTLDRRPSHVNYIPPPTPTTADSDKLPRMQHYHPPTDPTYRPRKSPLTPDMPEMPVKGKTSPKKKASPKKTSPKKTGEARGRSSKGGKKATATATGSKPQGVTKAIKTTIKCPQSIKKSWDQYKCVLAKPSLEQRALQAQERSSRRPSDRLTRAQAEKWSREQVQTHQSTVDWTRQEQHSPDQRLPRFAPHLDDTDDMESIHNAASIDMSDEDEPVPRRRQPSRSNKTVRFRRQPSKVLFRMAPAQTETSIGRMTLTAYPEKETKYIGPPTGLTPTLEDLGVGNGTSTTKPPKGKGPFHVPTVQKPPNAPEPPITITEGPGRTFEEHPKFTYKQPSPIGDSPSLLNGMRRSPRALELYEIQPLFDHIRNSIISFTEQHFSFELAQSERDIWPLQFLTTKYLPLLLTTQYIADGSQYGWRNFFTSSQSRPYLVAAIIGEYLKHHVFNATAFGFPEEVIEQLEDDDREYLHYDAFVRSKRRGMVMRVWFEELEREDKMRKAVGRLGSCAEVLADELLGVVEPLMPEKCFGRDEKGNWGQVRGKGAEAKRQHIKTKLSKLITEAALLHWGIRLKGEDGTIVRVAPSVQKGEKRYLDAPFEDVNAEMLKGTEHHMGGEEGDKPRIRMTLFSRVEAVVPNGPTYLDLVDIQDEARKDGEEDVDWEKVRKEQFVWPVAPDDVRFTEERKRGKLRQGEEMTAAYVTVYPILNKHKVYVEWESEIEKEYWSFQKDDGDNDEKKKDRQREHRLWGDKHTDRPEKDRRKEMNKKYGVPIKKAQRVTLRQAVMDSRTGNKEWLEDRWTTIWNYLVYLEPGYENLLTLYLACAGVSRFW